MSSVTCKTTDRLDGPRFAAREKALKVLLMSDVDSVDIDLSEFDYVSSAGLQVLLVAAEAAEAANIKGGKVTLLTPQPAIVEGYMVSGFDQIISIQR